MNKFISGPDDDLEDLTEIVIELYKDGYEENEISIKLEIDINVVYDILDIERDSLGNIIFPSNSDDMNDCEWREYCRQFNNSTYTGKC